MFRFMGIALLCLLLAAVIQLPTQAQGPATVVVYDVGMCWDTATIICGPPNTAYDVEAHNYQCSWRVLDSGTTDSTGYDKNRISKFAGGSGFTPFDTGVRIKWKFPSGKVPYTYASSVSSIFRDYNVSGTKLALPPGPDSFFDVFWEIKQNCPEMLPQWNEACWWVSPQVFTLTLPEHITFIAPPSITSSNPSDLVIDPPVMVDPRTVMFDIVSNGRTDPMAGVMVEADLAYDGLLPPAPYEFTMNVGVARCPVSDPFLPLETGPIAAGAYAFDRPGYYGSITGKVVFSNIDPDYPEIVNPQYIYTRIQLAQGGLQKREEWKFLPADGTFTLADIPEGNFEVAVHAHPWLRKAVDVYVIAGQTVDAGVFELKNGDLDGDNEVTTSDLSLVIINLREMGDPFPE
jgi:hypothetical protein